MPTVRVNANTDFAPISTLLERLFEDAQCSPTDGWEQAVPRVRTLPVDVTEQADTLILTAPLPGFAPEAVAIAVQDGILTIAAERPAPAPVEGAKVLLSELRHGKVERRLKLPYAIDTARIEAVIAHGLLTLTLPKAAESQGTRIQVRLAE